jgi:hypothetical protein
MRITGLQSHFDWAGVAAAGVGAGIGGAVGGGNIGTAASAIANAATRSAINGESFGANLIAAVPDVVAAILQRAVGTALDRVSEESPLKRLERLDTEADARPRSKYALQLAGDYPDSLPISKAALSLEALNLPNIDYILDTPRTAALRARAGVSLEDGPEAERSRNPAQSTDYVTVNSYDGKKTSMKGTQTLEKYFYELSNDYIGTGWGDGWLQTVHTSPNLDQDVVGRFEREITNDVQSKRSSQANTLSTLNIDSSLQLDQDIRMEVYTRLEAVSSAIQGRLGNKEADLFPYMQQLNEQLIARLDQINPTRNLAHYEGIESDPISDLPLFLFSPGALIESAGSSAVRVTGRVTAAERVSIVSGPKLLPGEGLVGTADDLLAAGFKGDNLTPHHIPSANRMSAAGVKWGDGIAINMEQPLTAGGRHRATFTYGTQADINMTARDALAAGAWDARGIYRADRLYTPQIRSSLQELIMLNKTNHPNIFVKPVR